MILPLSVEEERWIELFFTEQKGKVREKIDELMIESMLKKLKPDKRHTSKEKFYEEFFMIFKKFEFTYGQKLDIIWMIVTRQYMSILHDASKVEDSNGMESITKGMIKDILKRQAQMIKELGVVGKVSIDFGEDVEEIVDTRPATATATAITEREKEYKLSP